MVESEGLGGTTTIDGGGVLELLGGPDEGAGDGGVIIPTVAPVNAGRKWRGGSWGAPETSEWSELEEV